MAFTSGWKAEQLLEDITLNADAIQEIRGPVSMEMRQTKEAIEKDEGIKFYSAIRRRTEQEVNYIDKRIQRLQGMLSYGIVPILLNEIEGLQQQKDALLKSQERANIQVNQTPISINLLKVL